MEITIDDCSPQFQYYSKNNTWIQSHAEDDQTNNYYDHTFYATKTEGDSVSLTFNGTGIVIYGAKRFNHGHYSSQLDGGAESWTNGYSRDYDFQAELFRAGGLSPDMEHTVVLTNTPSKNKENNDNMWFDVDFAVITTAVQGKVYTTQYDDDSAAVQYFGSGWAKGDPNKDYYNTTAHVSARPSDMMRLQFNGSSIQVFGGLYTDHGNYSIVVDDGPELKYNGSFFRLQPQVPLYTASNLTDGPHTLTMINLGGPKGNFLDFDYAKVNSTIDPSGSAANTTGSNTTSSDVNGEASADSKSSSNVSAIAGGVAGGVVGLALVVILAWFLFRRKKKNPEGYPYAMKTKDLVDLNGEEVKPFQHNNQYHYPLPSSSSSSGDEIYQASPSTARENDHTNTPFLTALPAPPSSNATSYPRSVNPPSTIGRSPTITEGNQNPFSVAASSATFGHPQSTILGGSEESNDTSIPPVPSTRNANSVKSNGVTLPFTALPPIPSSNISSSDDPSPTSPQPPFALDEQRQRRPSNASTNTNTQRMYVPGRERDLGPLGLLDDDNHHDVFGTLPPDYIQATEPLPGQRPRRTE